MSFKLTAFLAGLLLVALIGIISLGYDKKEAPVFSGNPNLSGEQSSDAVPGASQPPEKQTFETSTKRLEARALAELALLDAEIEQVRTRLDEETLFAQQQEESPESVIASAALLLSELESEGVEITYDDSLYAPSSSSKEIRIIEKQIETIEQDLIEVERRFINLGDNQQEKPTLPANTHPSHKQARQTEEKQ